MTDLQPMLPCPQCGCWMRHHFHGKYHCRTCEQWYENPRWRLRVVDGGRR
jgi:hypothetical protein